MSSKIAEERIRILFEEAEERPDRAERYLKLAEKIGMRTETSIPSDLKKKYCRECYTVLIPGDNCTVRAKSGKGVVEYRCEACGNVERYGYR
jgi:ribonuclease P protein subunit RPR2